MCNEKKALLVVSFGTTKKDALVSIENIENYLNDQFDKYDFFRAFTSNIIRKKLNERDGEDILSPKQALQKIYDLEYTDVVVQSLHIINGFEFEKIQSEVMDFEDKFESITLGKALLTDEEDYKRVCEIINNIKFKREDGHVLLLMGHGTEHFSNACYSQLENYFEFLGYDDVMVSTVEGFPQIDYTIGKLKKRGTKKVTLMPFMIVFGDHAKNDMAGETRDSWKNMLLDNGFEVEILNKSLGDIEAIADMFYKHLGV